MSSQVKVEDFEIFTLFRVALLKFAQAADQSLSNADSQIARTRAWLETEQITLWTGQLRKRNEAVKVAREEVRKKKLYKDASGRTPGAVEEEKILARCLAAVEQAEQKIQAIKRWLPKLEKANDLYRGGVSPLSRNVGGDIPRAVALLDRLATSLDQYVQIEAPSSEAPAATVNTIDEGLPATPEIPAESPANAEANTEAVGAADSPAQKEDAHVTDGQ